MIYETDSEQDADHKIAIGWMKEGMRQMVEEGASPETILTEYRTKLKEIAALRLDLQRQLSALKREGDMEGAEAFVAEANRTLGAYGARPLVLYPDWAQRVPGSGAGSGPGTGPITAPRSNNGPAQ